MSNRRKIILNYPPASSVWHLPAGIAMLTSVLREKGHDVMQRYGHIIGLEHLLREIGGDEIDRALQTVRNEKSGVMDWYESRRVFEEVSDSVQIKDKFRVERNNVLYVSEHYDGTIRGLLDAINEREKSIWYSYFRDVELPIVLGAKPEIYGISISDERQLIQGMVLASLVKDASPDTLVAVGGNFWSRVRPAFQHPDFRRVLDHCDTIIHTEGFSPLEKLAETLSPSQSPGTVYIDNGEVKINPMAEEATSFETLPTPSFDGGAKQWSPDFVPELYTMSNCPMRCQFCAISGGSDTFLQTPRAMSPEKVAQVMIETGATRFDIADETFPVNRQFAVGNELKRKGYVATWNCYLTITDDLLNPDRCQRLYDAGCRGVQLGLESLSKETLIQQAKSWNNPKSYGRILKNLADAGIQNHVFLLVGFPGEPIESGLRWLPFLEDYGENILTIKAGRYRLTKNSPEEQRTIPNPHIRVEVDDKPLHLNANFSYVDPRTSRKRVEAMRDLLEQGCRNHWAYAVTSTIPWWTNRGRYTIDEIRQMAKLLPKEPQTPHIDLAIKKARGIIKEVRGKDYLINTYQDLVSGARHV